MKWSEVISEDQYKAQSPEKKSEIRDQYFNEVIVPQLDPEYIERAKNDFYKDTENIEPDVFKSNSPKSEIPKKIWQGIGAQLHNVPVVGEALNTAENLYNTFNDSESDSEKWNRIQNMPKGEERNKAMYEQQTLQDTLEDPTDLMSLGYGLGKLAVKGAGKIAGKVAAKGIENIGEKKLAGILGETAAEDVLKKEIPNVSEIALPTTTKEIKSLPSYRDILSVPINDIDKLDSTAIKLLGNKTTSNKIEDISPYINKLSERLGNDAQAIINDSTPDVERLGENKLLKNLSDAVYRKENMGDYGSITKVVNHQKIFPDGAKSVPVYEAEMNIMKDLPYMEKPQGLLEPSNRYIDKLGEPFKDLTYRSMQKAEHLKNIEYAIDKKEINQLKKSLPSNSSERIMEHAVAQQSGGEEILSKMKRTAPELTDKELNAYDLMRSKYESLYDRLQEARKLSGKEPFPKVDNYFTFFKNLDEMNKEGINPVLAKMDVISDFINPKSTPFAFAKKRLKNDIGVEMDAFNVFNKYNHSALQHIYLSPEISKAQALTRKLEDGTEKGFKLMDKNPYAFEALNQWINDVAGKKVYTSIGSKKLKWLDNIAEKANKNLVYSVLSFNFDSAAKQFLSLRNTYPEVGLRNLANGIKMNLIPGWRKFAFDKSAVLSTRFFETGIEEALNGSGKIKSKLGKIGVTPLQMLDAESARATWLASYSKAIKDKMPSKKAIDYADDVVIRTQGSANKMDRTPLTRTGTGRALTLFQTFANSDYQYLKKDILGIGENNKFNPSKLTKYIVATALLNKIYQDGLGMDAFFNPIREIEKSKDEGDSNAKAVFNALMETASVHPMMGSAKYGKTIGGSAISSIEKSLSKLNKGKKLDLLGGLLELGKLGGVPGYGQIVKRYNISQQGGNSEDILKGNYPKKKNGMLNIGKIPNIK
jgi:hypothetical protein